MAILVTCPGCGQPFQTRDANAGRSAECPDCGGALVVPSATGTAIDPFALGPRRSTPTSGAAIASALLGFVSLFCLFFAGVPAIIYGALAIRDVNRSGGRVRGRTLAVLGILLGGIGSTLVSALWLIPAVRSGMEAARRSQCTNNVKQIALALHNYHSVHGKFPPAAITDKQGNPLLSWRVAILPYLDQGQALYSQFNLTEPWDGPTNARLLSQMPAVFRCPSDVLASRSLTRYQAFVGPAGVFTGRREGTSIAEITAGTSNTVMFVEMDLRIPWTAPQDPLFNAILPTGGMGSSHPGGAHSAMADGSVR